MAAQGQGPLAGLRIIEIAGIGPGPCAAFMLADMGADITRVDGAQTVGGGDPSTPPADTLQRGLQLAPSLVRNAGPVVGQAQRFGAGHAEHDALRAIPHRVVDQVQQRRF